MSARGRNLARVDIRLKWTVIAPSPPIFDRNSRESGNPEGDGRVRESAASAPIRLVRRAAERYTLGAREFRAKASRRSG